MTGPFQKNLLVPKAFDEFLRSLIFLGLIMDWNVGTRPTRNRQGGAKKKWGPTAMAKSPGSRFKKPIGSGERGQKWWESTEVTSTGKSVQRPRAWPISFSTRVVMARLTPLGEVITKMPFSALLFHFNVLVQLTSYCGASRCVSHVEASR